MKPLAMLQNMGLVGALVAFTSLANAQDDGPVVEDFSIFPAQITGQTCVEDPDNKEIKCTTLETKDFVTVAALDVSAPGGSDVMTQFCAKVEDNNQPQLGLECQAVVDDGDPSAPGAIRPNEDADEEIYWFCMTWFGRTSGVANGHATVDIECKLKNEPTDDEVININSYSLAVSAK